jgi:hypothetical protein
MVELFEENGSTLFMWPAFERHPSDDDLELYSMGRLPEPASIGLEEHIIVCEHCQDRLRESDEYVRLIKDATKAIAKREGDSLTQLNQETTRAKNAVLWLRARTISPAAWTAIAAVVVGGIGLAVFETEKDRRRPVAQGEVAVELQAVRGVGSPSITASSAASVRLAMDTTGLPAGTLQVVVVDSAGRRVWSGATEAQNNRATAVVNQNLPAGQYWIRLGAGTEPLREFGLAVR